MSHHPTRFRNPDSALELELLFLSSRIVFDSNTRGMIETLVRRPLDWDHLIETAEQHKVLPLLHRCLTLISFPVPAPAMSCMRNTLRANARRNFLITGELLQIIELFRTHGIRAIPYKGPILAAAVYGDVSLRQFDDLDIIVPLSSAQQAMALLASRGYKAEKEMNTQELQYLIRNEKDLSLMRESDRMTVELHWGITNESHPIQVSPDFLWKDLTTFSICGKTVPIHAPEDLLVILCIHGANHRWERLGWLCDIAEIIRSYKTLDWDRLIEQASRLRCQRIVFLGVLLAMDVLGAEVPSKVQRAIEGDRVVSRLLDQVKEWMASESTIRLGEKERFCIRVREHRLDRFLVAAKQAKACLAITSRDAETFRVPEGFAWTLYIVRPFRLAWEYGLNPLKSFLKGVREAW